MERTRDPWRRVQISGAVVLLVIVAGTLAYTALGLSLLDALYQTVTTISTVGFREYGNVTAAWKATTILVIVFGVGAAFYTFGLLLETLVEGRLNESWDRRRRERKIGAMRDHIIICGWGRVGRAIHASLGGENSDTVVIDMDPERAALVSGTVVEGDATDDEVLRRAGIEHARCVIVALVNDADNVYVTLSARALRPDLLIVARARNEAAVAKLIQAGADRVVNPQQIGGARMAALATQPAVADFLDVVMHDGSLEFQLAEVRVGERSGIVGRTVQEAQIRDTTGALILAVREPVGDFVTNPSPSHVLGDGQVLIAIGTAAQIAALQGLAASA